MSRLKNIPKIQLAVLIAPAIIKLRLELENKALKELEEIQNTLIGECPEIKVLESYNKKVSNIKSFLNKVARRGNDIKKTLDPLIKAERAILAAVTVLELLPAPNTFTTVGVTNKAAQLLADIKQFAKDIHDEVFLISGLIEGSLGILTLVDLINTRLNTIDLQLSSCVETGELDEEALKVVSEGKETLQEATTQYTDPTTGQVYDIRVVLVSDKKIAPLRQAVAYDRSGIARYRSAQSFSSSTQVLVDEVKLRIDNNIII